jgi:hypothetical protein
VQYNDTFECIKQKILDKEGIPVQRQRLMYSGKIMFNYKHLNDHNIQMEATLHLITRLPASEIDKFVPIATTKQEIRLFGTLPEDITQHTIQFMDITSLIAFSLTSKNSYNLVNKDYRIWERIGTSYNIGDTKLDCLYWLDDSFQPIKDGKAEKKRKA